jgi:hypothetical protein
MSSSGFGAFLKGPGTEPGPVLGTFRIQKTGPGLEKKPVITGLNWSRTKNIKNRYRPEETANVL